MNKLIEQIADDVVAKLIPRYVYIDIPDEFLESFAQAVVRECLDIVERHEYSYHEADPLWETAQLIKQRFGLVK